MPDVSIHSGVRSPLSVWRQWRRKAAQPRNVQTTAPAQLIVIEGVRYVVGLEWRLLPPTRSLQRTLSLARKERKSQYVLTDMEDIIGFCGPLPYQWTLAYSAAMHLAGRLSQGGLEMYAFALANGQSMVVALNESRPIPGFDFVGEADIARGLIDEFLAIQQGQPIRLVGNAGWLEGEESVVLEDIFAQPVRAARLKRLWADNAVKWAAGAAGVLALAVAGGNYWVEMERAEMIAAAQNPSIDPNAQYQKALAQAWADLMADLPLVHAGWRLKNVECDAKFCKAQWSRIYGTYADFFKQLPPNCQSAQEVQEGDNALQAMVVSNHSVAAEDIETPWRNATLPRMDHALRELASDLQNFSLLGQLRVELSKPTLFGGTQDPLTLDAAVMTGQWTVQHDASTLGYLTVPSYGVPKRLVLQVSHTKEKSAMTYLFEGQYYVQAVK
jgi:hypothetical protein